MDVILVPTTHWDREWYRTFQAFRARLIDTIDHVLELLDRDDGYTFLLDGQSIVLEDYVEIRPERRRTLSRRRPRGRTLAQARRQACDADEAGPRGADGRHRSPAAAGPHQAGVRSPRRRDRVERAPRTVARLRRTHRGGALAAL